MKKASLVMLVMTWGLSLGLVRVRASECCYSQRDIVPGLAEGWPAEFEVNLADPRNPQVDSLGNKTINVVIFKPKPGQWCELREKKTTPEGLVRGWCFSPEPGIMWVYFRSDELSEGENQMLRKQLLKLDFLPAEEGTYKWGKDLSGSEPSLNQGSHENEAGKDEFEMAWWEWLIGWWQKIVEFIT